MYAQIHIHSLQLYIEGYLQAMLDTMYRQEYLRVKVIDDQVKFLELRFALPWWTCHFPDWPNIYTYIYIYIHLQVFLKNLPPSNSLIDEMIDRVKGFLESRGLLKGDPSSSRPRRRLHGDKVKKNHIPLYSFRWFLMDHLDMSRNGRSGQQ